MSKLIRPFALNSSGFSIMEMVIATAIGGIMIAAMANMSYYQSMELASAEAKIGSMNLQRDVEMLLRDPTACMSALQTKANFQNGMDMSFNLGWSGGVLFAGNQSPPNYGVKINSLKFTQVGAASGTLYTGTLEIVGEAAKGRKLAFNKVLIPMYLTVPAGVGTDIASCTTAQTTPNGSCPYTMYSAYGYCGTQWGTDYNDRCGDSVPCGSYVLPPPAQEGDFACQFSSASKFGGSSSTTFCLNGKWVTPAGTYVPPPPVYTMGPDG